MHPIHFLKPWKLCFSTVLPSSSLCSFFFFIAFLVLTQSFPFSPTSMFKKILFYFPVIGWVLFPLFFSLFFPWVVSVIWFLDFKCTVAKFVLLLTIKFCPVTRLWRSRCKIAHCPPPDCVVPEPESKSRLSLPRSLDLGACSTYVIYVTTWEQPRASCLNKVSFIFILM